MTGIFMSYMATSKPVAIPAATTVTNGLVYYIDAGIASSYSGSGTSMNNISSSGLGASVVANGPTFTSAGGNSYFSFNGSTQLVYTPNLKSAFTSPDNANLTLEVWVRTASDNGVITSEQGNSPINTGWHTVQQEIVSGNINQGIYTTGGNVAPTATAVTRNIWQQYVMTYDDTGHVVSSYVNGTSAGTTIGTRYTPFAYSSEYYYSLMGADTTSYGDGTSLVGDWAIFRVYNRALSASEVQQNYDATKSRYSIVSTNLLLHLDAGYTTSYPGSGSTWTNLASSSLNGTLGAGVTYSSANGGSLAFNGGATAVVTITTASTVTSITNNITTEVWYKASTRQPRLISTGAGSNGFCFGYFSSVGTAWKVTKYGKVDLQAGTIPSNTSTWHQAVLVYSSTGGTSVYIDGAFSGSTSPADTQNLAASSPATITIGKLESTYHSGNISVVRVYNKVLSASEIQQNFDATRGRYGI